jgi:predicted DCC family thiol-disulfide oxidoreductase YuxK
MKTLTVIYDSRCGLCTHLKGWLARRPAYVPIELIAAGSPEALRRFPMLPAGELAAVSDAGQVWLGDHAWIMCLWALREYRAVATRLSSPALKPLARQAFGAISRSREHLSWLLGFQSEHALQDALSGVEVPPCRIIP